PANEPGVPERQATFSPSGEAKRSEGSPDLLHDGTRQRARGVPERQATFSPADEVEDIRGRAPTCSTTEPSNEPGA
ncbi:MAG: hypothetical protein O2884_14915, partial [Chloroflexi bacterium]|nr:hypothetical protein [Chloroflexota bacterium]